MSSESAKTARVFVSHSQKDQVFTAKLVADLRTAGADVWVDTEELQHDDFIRLINEGLANRDWLILVQTPDALQSPWVQMEVNAAINLKVQRRMRGVIPILAEVCDPDTVPPTWSTLQYYDAISSYDRALAGILRVLGLSAKAAAPTTSPRASGHSSRPSDTARPARLENSNGPTSSSSTSRNDIGNTPYNFEDPTGFSDYFETLFGRRSSTGTATRTKEDGQAGAIKGEDIEQQVEITLREAFTGTKRSYTVQAPEMCAVCNGTGRVGSRTCAVCGGAGSTMRTKNLEVNIPAGVDTGSRVKVVDEGRPGIGGGPRGDLYLVVTVKPDPLFERKGDDLWVNISIPPALAKQGGEVQVNRLDGSRLLLNIPRETANGQAFRLAGQGMPKVYGGSRGDMYVRAQVGLEYE